MEIETYINICTNAYTVTYMYTFIYIYIYIKIISNFSKKTFITGILKIVSLNYVKEIQKNIQSKSKQHEIMKLYFHI